MVSLNSVRLRPAAGQAEDIVLVHLQQVESLGEAWMEPPQVELRVEDGCQGLAQQQNAGQHGEQLGPGWVPAQLTTFNGAVRTEAKIIRKMACEID